ncbi:hypothetical protein [Halobacteriovorax sp. HLS]|uniref:hypothetical protein n=1 Tax=Halobacteriovorax sp. HLS TaxID=2234000 RepID=UPI000FDA384C|nr:hypothetical protein [Halobacteriovorax sp. HLS]
MNKPVVYKILKISELQNSQQEEMYSLFERYYNDVNFEMFKQDLQEKTHIFMLYNLEDEIIGFSTIFRKSISKDNKNQYTALFSGDTVIREDYWGTKALQKAFFFFIVQSKVLSGKKPLYWFLQSKGFKTYLMMRRNFEFSYPQHAKQTPKNIQIILQDFYSDKYKDAFKPKSGLIQFNDSKGAAKAEVCSPNRHDLLNEDIQFFIKRNPNFHLGDELACVTEICYSDFAKHIPKYFLKVPLLSKFFKNKEFSSKYN